jgi:hypothetical protein
MGVLQIVDWHLRSHQRGNSSNMLPPMCNLSRWKPPLRSKQTSLVPLLVGCMYCSLLVRRTINILTIACRGKTAHLRQHDNRYRSKKGAHQKEWVILVEINNFLSDIRAFHTEKNAISGQIVSIRIDGIWHNIESVVVREETLSVTTKEEFVSEIGGEIQAPPWPDPTRWALGQVCGEQENLKRSSSASFSLDPRNCLHRIPSTQRVSRPLI